MRETLTGAFLAYPDPTCENTKLFLSSFFLNKAGWFGEDDTTCGAVAVAAVAAVVTWLERVTLVAQQELPCYLGHLPPLLFQTHTAVN